MAEGETQYNIPVSSKQLIVYFVFLVIALSAAFLAGVMVGRNVDSSPEPTVRDMQYERTPDESAASPTPAALTYGSSLQNDKGEGLSPSTRPLATPASSKPLTQASLPKPSPAKPGPPRAAATPRATPESTRATPPVTAVKPASAPKPTASPAATQKAPAKPTPKPAAPAATSSPRTAKPAPTPLNRLTIQVGAFKERAAAESIVRRLKAKGYSAYLVPVAEGLFNVRVGSFTDREDAQRTLSKLETQEKFKPFIVKP